MIKRIQEILERKKREKIRNEYLDLIQKHPDDTRSRLKLGDLYAKEGRKKEAVEQYMASAEIFSKAGFHLKSIALFKQVMKLDPGSVHALRRAASISCQYSLYTDALPYFERLAGVLRNDRKNESLLRVYDGIAGLPVRDTRRRVQLYEALFPAAGASDSDPYERLFGIAKAMTREGADREDARAVVHWMAAFFPDRIELQEFLLGLLTGPGDHDALVEALDRLESMYRDLGILGEKSDFLESQRLAAERMVQANTIRESPRAAGGARSPAKVKVQMEANIYDLLEKKSREAPPPSQDMSGTSEGAPGAGRSALDRLEFGDLFQTFKESIQGQVAQDDSETHYNLGVAYLEMELFEDAIEEFRLAGRNPSLQYDSYCMMGHCFRELERFDDAIQMYEKALSSSGLSQEQSCAIRYEKAVTLSTAGRNEEALEVFSEIREIDNKYRDIDQKIKEASAD